MIEPSRIFSKESRDLKTLTIARESYINELTREKNRIHQSLESCCIKLSSVLSDIFGKGGRYILNGMLDGEDVEDLLGNLPVSRLRKKADQIREAIQGTLDATQILLIRGSLEHMEATQKRIDMIDQEIRIRAANRKDDLSILMSFPGIGFTSAVTILAEIGNYRDFHKAAKLAIMVRASSLSIPICGQAYYGEYHETRIKTSKMDACRGRTCYSEIKELQAKAVLPAYQSKEGLQCGHRSPSSKSAAHNLPSAH